MEIKQRKIIHNRIQLDQMTVLPKASSTILPAFRSHFEFPNVQRINWYPGHMVKATRIMCEKLKLVDYVIEVRDCRLPFTSVNPVFDSEVAKRNKPRLLILNKADLCSAKQQEQIRRCLQERQQASEHAPRLATMFTSAKQGTNIRNIVREALTKYPVEKKFKTIPFMFMIAGIPNVGKSSIINALRMKNKINQNKSGSSPLSSSSSKASLDFTHSAIRSTATKTAKAGATPGVTRDVNSFVVATNPTCLLMDTPGVLFPNLETHENAFRLALINALPDELLSVGPEMLVDFLLYEMNRKQYFDYVKIFKMPEPTDDVHLFLGKYVCSHIRAITSQGEPDIKKASLHVLKMFREGKLGKIVLDDMDGAVRDTPSSSPLIV